MSLLTQAALKERYSYDPVTGVFVARVRTGGVVRAGDPVGTLKDGYVRISWFGQLHYAHRLAFLYMTGSMPAEIDHRNRKRADNRWSNLRAVTHSQNASNCVARKNCKSGEKNIHRLANGRFRVLVKRGGKTVFDRVEASLNVAALARDAFLNGG